MRPAFREFVKYALASGAALAVDVGVLAFLVTGERWAYLPAAALSFTAGGIFLYALSIRLVFQFRRIPKPSVELPVFLALGMAGLAVNCLVMFAAVSMLHASYLPAKGLAAVCTFGLNYIVRRGAMFSGPARPAASYAIAD